MRKKWKAHTETSLIRPVLLIDEAQEMNSAVLSELRILAAGQLDTETYLTVVLAGDSRLIDRFRLPDLVPLASRIRTRLLLEYASQEELREVLQCVLKKAGNPNLLSTTLQNTLVEHSAGNYRVLMMLAGELLMAACEREMTQIDEKLYFELYNTKAPKRSARKPG